MTPERSKALGYLRAPANVRWRWAENGAVLVWHDGTTIAFREEVAAVLGRLAPGGLPPFSCIVHLLAACRGKTPAVLDVLGEPSSGASASTGRAELLKTARDQLSAQVAAMLSELQKVTQLPTDLRSNLNAKTLLAELVFEPARVERQTDGAGVLAGLHGPFSDEELNGEPASGWTVSQVAHLFILSRGLKELSTETLRLRMQTGLDALPGAAKLDLKPAALARRLLEELARDNDHAGLAKAARELMAAIRLPRRLDVQDHLAIGGVADIANRGPLDRLLLSELAHDDLTLATRVALNEALYLRREPPAHEPPSTLALLIDSGVRLWGTPRLFAVAVALALIARDRHHTRVTAWRAEGKSVVPVDLLSKTGLTAHLAELDTHSNPGLALAAFQAKENPNPANVATIENTVLVTHRDTLDDPEFRAALAVEGHAPGFVATVDRNGTFELHVTPLAHRPPVCSANIDLQTLFAARPASAPIIEKSLDSSLPLIFNVRPFPLLLPVTGKLEAQQAVGEGEAGICVTQDRRILKWSSIKQGALQLAAGIPAGKTLWLRSLANGAVALVRFQQGQQQLHFVRTEPSGPWQSTSFPCSEQPRFIFDEGEVLLLIGRKTTEVRHLHSGELIKSIPTPTGPGFEGPGFHGRLCTFRDEWFAVHWNGEKPCWDPVSLPQGITFDRVLLMFYREGTEGPLVLTRDGAVFNCDGTRIFNSGRNLKWAKASEDGHRILVSGLKEEASQLFDLREGRVRVFASGAERMLNPRVIVPFRQVRCRFFAIHAREPGIITLYAPSGTGLMFKPVAAVGVRGVPCLVCSPKDKHHSRPASSLPFNPFPAPSELGCQLSMAQWPKGSRAFLDSRGLLHLKSHDPSIPEISLVLREGDATGWTSDGLMCGPRFFLSQPAGSPEEFARRVARFLEKAC